MSETAKIPNPPTFRWYPKHLNHITEKYRFPKTEYFVFGYKSSISTA
ncbi:MAG: hypothetical protein U5L45_16360 [Saprospiraceae bacterium]|nr:hypothetical protein [Saprospiraceae bacterium]